MKKFEIDKHEPSFLPKGKKWKLAWSDEFDGDTLDETKWMYRMNFWGKPFPAFCNKGVELDGKSHLIFHPVKMDDGRICSAQLQTGANSFDNPKDEGMPSVNPCGDNNFWPIGKIPEPKFMHRYGYYEVRCKLQKTDGWWSAFWMQSCAPGTTYDPAWSGVEVDIMEHFSGCAISSGNLYGGYSKDIKRAAHVRYDLLGKQDFNTEECKKIKDEFHRFGVLWTENEYVFYYDGKETARTNGPISQVPQFILLTTEIQGYRHGDGTKHDERAERSLDDKFIVDYVRVFDEVKE